MRVLIIGCGSIGNVLAKAAQGMGQIDLIYFTDKSAHRAEARVREYSKGRLARYDDEGIAKVIKEVDLVIEAASQEAARKFAPMCLERGRDIMVMSVGAFYDDDFRERCFRLAGAKRARLYIPSGAVCGTDGLRSAHGRIDEVHLITTKGPNGFKDVPYLEEKGIDVSKLKEPMVLFEGSAREAVRLFPRNVNVAATVSLMGVGFDHTKVTIVCDPRAEVNSHRLVARGEFGELTSEIHNVPSPENPATSYLAALSAVSALKSIATNVWVGV
ncbi:MAG: aspartate dehydrogenase [Methanomassiliicoccales archaeon]|jgi:aspartate dehydrogenase|nr:aspartate dehydrogenase [Methanomassiliicoccales archaeon]